MFCKYTRNHRIPHMMITLKGRFKGEEIFWWYSVPLADQKKSGIPTRRWISWILYRQYNLEKQERGLLFARDNGQKASTGDYDHMFRKIGERSKSVTGVIHHRSIH